MGWNKITNGLFPYKPKFCWRNIKRIPCFFQRIGYVLKHGYSPIARWDYSAWFIDTTKDIFTEYLKYHVGYKIIDDTKDEEWNCQAWENVIKEMIDCLTRMDENAYYDTKPCRYDETGNKDDLMKWYDEVEKEMDIAKQRFFFLFNQYFYDLWD